MVEFPSQRRLVWDRCMPTLCSNFMFIPTIIETTLTPVFHARFTRLRLRQRVQNLLIKQEIDIRLRREELIEFVWHLAKRINDVIIIESDLTILIYQIIRIGKLHNSHPSGQFLIIRISTTTVDLLRQLYLTVSRWSVDVCGPQNTFDESSLQRIPANIAPANREHIDDADARRKNVAAVRHTPTEAMHRFHSVVTAQMILRDAAPIDG
jgi:hypothetical protein